MKEQIISIVFYNFFFLFMFRELVGPVDCTGWDFDHNRHGVDYGDMSTFLEEIPSPIFRQIPAMSSDDDDKSSEENAEQPSVQDSDSSSDNSGGTSDRYGEPSFEQRDERQIARVRETLAESTPVTSNSREAVATDVKSGPHRPGNFSGSDRNSDGDDVPATNPRSSGRKIAYVQPGTSPENSDPDDQTYEPPG